MAADPSPIALRLLGQDHALEPGRVYLLGSSGDSDFVLGEAAAPRHARLAVDADGVVVEDLGAAEGTWCNGERIARRRLQVGDVLRLGPLEAVVVPDHGVAALVPIPALRAAASARRLQAIGARGVGPGTGVGAVGEGETAK